MEATPSILCLSPVDIGKIVRTRRRKLGYTQEQLATSVGMSPRLIGEVERGKPGTAIEKIFVICMTLGLDLRISERSR